MKAGFLNGRSGGNAEDADEDVLSLTFTCFISFHTTYDEWYDSFALIALNFE